MQPTPSPCVALGTKGVTVCGARFKYLSDPCPGSFPVGRVPHTAGSRRARPPCRPSCRSGRTSSGLTSCRRPHHGESAALTHNWCSPSWRRIFHFPDALRFGTGGARGQSDGPSRPHWHTRIPAPSAETPPSVSHILGRVRANTPLSCLSRSQALGEMDSQRNVCAKGGKAAACRRTPPGVSTAQRRFSSRTCSLGGGKLTSAVRRAPPVHHNWSDMGKGESAAFPLFCDLMLHRWRFAHSITQCVCSWMLSALTKFSKLSVVVQIENNS